MFTVFNKAALTRNQRFLRGLLFGSLVTIGLAVVYGMIAKNLGFEFSYVFIAIGYLIGLTIQKTGRGVQVQFSILGAVLAFLCFFVADMITIFGFNAFMSIDRFIWCAGTWFTLLFNFSGINQLLMLGFRAVGIAVAFKNSRVV